MRLRFTLNLKMIFTTLLVVILSFLFLAYLNIKRQRNFLELAIENFGINTAQALEANIRSREELAEVKRLQTTILKLLYSNPLINSITVNLPVEEKLKVVASNESELIGREASLENLSSYRDGKIRTARIKGREKRELLRVIVPIRLSGEIVGTYEIKLNLEPFKELILKGEKEFFITALFSLAFIVISLFLLIHISVIKPVKEIQKGMREIGEGKLDFRITSKRKDEFGDLISGFNQMADQLQKNYQQLREIQKNLENKVMERTRELEEAKMVLEIKVRARTRELRELAESLEKKVRERTKALEESQKELQRKVRELEKFHQLAVERELKMLEMKKRIRELERELEEKNKKQ